MILLYRPIDRKIRDLIILDPIALKFGDTSVCATGKRSTFRHYLPLLSDLTEASGPGIIYYIHSFRYNQNGRVVQRPVVGRLESSALRTCKNWVMLPGPDWRLNAEGNTEKAKFDSRSTTLAHWIRVCLRQQTAPHRTLFPQSPLVSSAALLCWYCLGFDAHQLRRTVGVPRQSALFSPLRLRR